MAAKIGVAVFPVMHPTPIVVQQCRSGAEAMVGEPGPILFLIQK